jgi:hypothetical protein
MQAVMEFLKGKRTYIVAIAMLILGALQGLDIFIMPEWGWGILGAVGLGTLRAGVNTVAKKVEEQAKANGNG